MKKKTALHKAVKGGHLEIVKILLDRGADVTLRDKVSGMRDRQYFLYRTIIFDGSIITVSTTMCVTTISV